MVISKYRKIFGQDEGFTLVEVLIAAAIMAIVLVGIMQLFIYCATLTDTAGGITMAMAEVQKKMEEIRNHDFGDITTDYASGGTPGDTFTLTQVPGMGKIYITALNATLLQVEVVASWETERGRIIGEDDDLDGALDSGEDNNGDGTLDSITRLTTLISKR